MKNQIQESPQARVTIRVVYASAYRRSSRKQIRRERHILRSAWAATPKPRSFGKVW